MGNNNDEGKPMKRSAEEKMKALCAAAIEQSNMKLSLEIYMNSVGIRPAELPAEIDGLIAGMIGRRLSFEFTARDLGLKTGDWKIMIKAIQIASFGKPEA